MASAKLLWLKTDRQADKQSRTEPRSFAILSLSFSAIYQDGQNEEEKEKDYR